MDLENLRAFVAIVEYQSFSLAAEKLFITQPAISKRLSSLEQVLDAELIDRSTRGLHVTSAGQALLPRAEAILSSVAEAKQEIADLSGEVRGELRVATSHHLGLHKLPPVLRAFSSAYPLVDLRFEFLDSEVAQNRVISGKAELAVITLPPEPAASLETEVLWEDSLVFVSQAGSKVDSNVTLTCLSKQAAILPDLNTYTGRLIKKQFDEQGLSLRLNMATNYLETIKMMVSVGLGWSVLPASMVDDQIRKFEVLDVQMTRQLGAVKHTRRTLSNAASAFYAILRAKSQSS